MWLKDKLEESGFGEGSCVRRPSGQKCSGVTVFAILGPDTRHLTGNNRGGYLPVPSLVYLPRQCWRPGERMRETAPVRGTRVRTPASGTWL